MWGLHIGSFHAIPQHVEKTWPIAEALSFSSGVAPLKLVFSTQGKQIQALSKLAREQENILKSHETRVESSHFLGSLPHWFQIALLWWTIRDHNLRIQLNCVWSVRSYPWRKHKIKSTIIIKSIEKKTFWMQFKATVLTENT